MKYVVKYKSMMDNSTFQHTEEHPNDKEAISKNKHLYGVSILKKIYPKGE